MTEDPKDPKLVAAVELIGRTGATQTEIRYCEEEKPVVWFAIATYRGGQRAIGAAFNPTEAVLALCVDVLDGGQCMRCKRPVGFEPHELDDMPLGRDFCWYQWDPELKKYRRSCEGDETTIAAQPSRWQRRRR